MATNGTNEFGIDDDVLALQKTAHSVEHAITFYAVPPNVVFGMTGNILTFLVMMQPDFRSTTSSIFMRCLSISDSLYMIFRLLQKLILNILVDILVEPYKEWICQEYLFMATYLQILSLIVLVTMNVDRVFALLWPFKARVTCSTLKPAKIVAVCIFLVPAAILFPIHRRQYSANSRNMCPYLLYGTWVKVNGVVLFFNVYVFLALLIVSNIVIVIRLHRNTHQASKLRDSVDQKRIKRDNQITVMLLTVTTTYILSYMPVYINLQYWLAQPKSYSLKDLATQKIVREITVVVHSLNYACNFYIYLITCTKFRIVLSDLLKKRIRSIKTKMKMAEITPTNENH